jgi:hypothetical protein
MRELYVFMPGAALAAPVLVGAQKPQAARAQAAMHTISIPIKGMACSACASHIRKTLSAIEGVESVEEVSQR